MTKVWNKLLVTDTHMQCCKCKEVKPHCDFHKDSTAHHRHNLAYNCKVCACTASKALHHVRMKTDQTYRDTKKNSYLKAKYGITKSDYDKTLLATNSCEICRESLVRVGSKIHLDHCHKTGAVRGVLCSKCNQGLGFFKDSASLLKSAEEYITRYKA